MPHEFACKLSKAIYSLKFNEFHLEILLKKINRIDLLLLAT